MTSGASDAALSLEEVDLIRRRVINVVGHELRTPIATLAGLAAELQTADVDDVRTRLGPAIHRLAERTEALLDDLLVASGVATALPVEPAAPVALAAVVERALAELGDVAAGVAVTVADDVTVMASPGVPERIVRNVLRNALTYGEGAVSVTVSAADSVGHCTIENPAPGATEAELALAFEPFFRGEHAVLRAHGFGMGLTVAQILARHAGGDVSLTWTADPPPPLVVTTVELPVA